MIVSRRSLLDEADANLKCHVILRGLSTCHVIFDIGVIVIAQKLWFTQLNKLTRLVVVMEQWKGWEKTEERANDFLRNGFQLT